MLLPPDLLGTLHLAHIGGVNLPLAFESISHGTIAFGFFNIESDMLLLDRYFFFATEFCDMVTALADQEDSGDSDGVSWQIRLIESAADIGDLMGAIHGVRFCGFIGDVYRCYPFPENPADFKQNPNGFATQAEMKSKITPYAASTDIRVVPNAVRSEIDIGSYRFKRLEFHRLLDYVWLGGYPRWKDDIRPDYVADMQARVLSSATPLFKGVEFSL